MFEYKVSSPTSRTVDVGRTEQGDQSAFVAYNGGSATPASAPDAAALATAEANLAPMINHSRWLAERINERSGTVDPRSGEQPFVRSESERKRLMLLLRQNDQTIAFQREQALVAAQKARDEEAARVASMNAEQVQRDAIERRAREIALEDAAKQRAKKLTIR